ncbi:hypothetical protein CEXT_773141 [Caerostris extrusa]|uniref:Kinesin motor domain-containing protein n=1 Tax=Caerostris extrusa TaxID=172846 RepID=A0AAV4QGJ8_CAEEX|nr:hypothetical protein CEXT_773141 [Caerostris extrusa]
MISRTLKKLKKTREEKHQVRNQSERERYNTSIIAYGAIGTGKSYTIGTNFMKGADKRSNAGIIQRIVHDLFREMGTKNFVLKISFLEVLGLTEFTVDSPEKVFDILENNAKNRKARHSHLMFNIT